MKNLRTVGNRIFILVMAFMLVSVMLPAPAKAVTEPLILQRAEVTTGGGIGLTFDRAVSGEDFVDRIRNGFTITGLDRTISITNATLHGGSNNFVQLYFNDPVRGGEAVGLSYTPGNVQAADGGLLAEIPSMDITNNLPHPELAAAALPLVTVGIPYNFSFLAESGTPPYAFTLDVGSGELPPGMSLSSTGNLTGTPTTAGTYSFAVFVTDAANAIDIEPYTMTVAAVPVNVCEVSGTGYLTLEEGLAAVAGGGTIRLLRDINYNKGVFVKGSAVSFELNGHKLNISNEAEGGVGLDVQSGGSVDVTGTGELNVSGRAFGVRVSTSAAMTRAFVTSAKATGPWGEAVYVAGPGVLSVSGDVTSLGINGFGAHAVSGGTINVQGNVHGSNQGVYASSSHIMVAGNVLADGTDILGDPAGIGIGVYGSTGKAEIAGDVTASRIGVTARASGTVLIDGKITAPKYIQFADNTAVIPDEHLETTTREGYHTYAQESYGVVWVKIPPAPVDISAALVTLDKEAFICDGTSRTPIPTVVMGGTTLSRGTDYLVEYADNVYGTLAAGGGIPTVTIKGINGYGGMAAKTFTINKPCGAVSLVKVRLYGYDDIQASWSGVAGASEYYVYYKKAGADTWSNAGAVTGTVRKLRDLADGTKYYIKVIPYFKAGEKKFAGGGKTSAGIYTLRRLPAPKVRKYSYTRVKVYFTNIPGESGYQISQAVSKSRTSIVSTFSTATAKSRVIKTKRGKTDYYKIRAYKTVDGKRIYGPWSGTAGFKL